MMCSAEKKFHSYISQSYDDTNYTNVWKSTKKVAFDIASEASYVYILSFYIFTIFLTK